MGFSAKIAVNLLLAVMILLASVNYTFAAPECCAAVDIAAHDTGGGTDGCADCLFGCHASPSFHPGRMSDMPVQGGSAVIPFADDVMQGHDPSILLKPPRST
jgi:hypothetical protein